MNPNWRNLDRYLRTLPALFREAFLRWNFFWTAGDVQREEEGDGGHGEGDETEEDGRRGQDEVYAEDGSNSGHGESWRGDENSRDGSNSGDEGNSGDGKT